MDLLNDLEEDTKIVQQAAPQQTEMMLTSLINELPKATPNFDEGPGFDIELRSDLQDDFSHHDDEDLNNGKLLSSNNSLNLMEDTSFHDIFQVGNKDLEEKEKTNE